MGPHLDVWYGTVPNHALAIAVRAPAEPDKAGADARPAGAKQGAPKLHAPKLQPKLQYRRVSTTSGVVDQPWLIGTSIWRPRRLGL